MSCFDCGEYEEDCNCNLDISKWIETLDKQIKEIRGKQCREILK